METPPQHQHDPANPRIEEDASVFLDISELSVAYQGRLVLDDFTLTLAKGELFVLLGASGCGKTTALRAIAGLTPAQQGTIRLGGRDLTGLPTHKRRVGMVFQNAALFPHLTVLRNVTFGLGKPSILPQNRADRARARNVAMAMLDLVGLADRAEARPSELSGGQQQRVALARALVTKPDLLLLDEPLAALDAQVRGRVRAELVRVLREVGTTAIFVTHDQDEAFQIADRVGLMDGGRLEQVGSPEDLYLRPASETVRAFIGRINRIPGHLVGLEGTWMVRPEDLVLSTVTDGSQKDGAGSQQDGAGAQGEGAGAQAAEPAPSGAKIPTLAGVVVDRTFLGSSQIVEVELDDGTQISVQCRNDEPHAAGDRVLVSPALGSAAMRSLPGGQSRPDGIN